MRLPKHGLSALACALLWLPAVPRVAAAQQNSTQQVARVPDAQLDSLVAPIALYPDPLLAQVLAASTYPLELVEMQQWVGQHADLKDQALVDEVSKQTWDASVQGLAALPDVVRKMTEDIKWTTSLGNAFLAQQSDVMDAVQRMRGKASGAGQLKSNDKMKVETQTVENKSVIVIEQSNPQVVYVPDYNPTVVYGSAPAYPYPAVRYPLAGAAISFGVGMAMGAAFSGGWGYNCGWHGGGGNNNININNNNNFVKNSGNRTGGGNQWQHNPQHRGGAPYGNRETANKFGGTTRGESGARAQGGGNRGGGQAGGGDRGGGNRGGGQAGGGDRGGGNRGGGGQAGGGGNRGGGGDRVGNHSVQGGGGGGSAFGGGGGGGGGQAARSSSSRGGGSTGGGSRGGGSRGGGSRGGGGRGGGGGRR